jgi:hypothetical protein
MIIRYTRAFFDEHLRGKPQPLFCAVATRTLCRSESHRRW